MPRSPGRRRLILAGAAVAAGGVALALGPAAPWLVDQFADGARVWRLGQIDIDGVSGAWLGDLSARRVVLTDADGVWLQANNLALAWRPIDLLLGCVRIDTASAADIALLRQPTLLQRRRAGDANMDVHIGRLRIDNIALSEAVVGDVAAFTTDFALDIRDKRLTALEFALQRIDSDADHIVASYRETAPESLRLDAAGAPGGVLARALGVPERAVRATASGEGGPTHGAVSYQAAIGDDPLVSGNVHWTAADWSATAAARLDLLPALTTLSRRIGSNLSLEISGAHAGAFTAHAQTPFLTADLDGVLDERREGAAHVTAKTQRLSDIARESPFPLGAASLHGEVRRARGTLAIEAELDAKDVDVFGQSTRFAGPVRAALTRERFTLTSELRAPAEAPPLFTQARLGVELGFDRARGRFSLDHAALSSDALDVDAQGWVTRGDGELSGDWRIRRLQALAPELRGEAGGGWRAASAPRGDGHVWSTSLAGEGANLAGAPDIIPQLLGQAPRLDARFIYEHRGLTVSHARIDGAKLRAAATGRVVAGQAELALEATARGPLAVGAVEITGALDATGRLSGRIARPSLTMRAALSGFNVSGFAVERPLLMLSLTPGARGYGGHADLIGRSAGHPLTLSADTAISRGALALSALEGRWGGLRGQGSARFAREGASADLAIDGGLDGLVAGVSGHLSGALAFSPGVVRLNAQIADARAGELHVRAAHIAAEGPPDAIAARFDLRGRLRQAPLTFAGIAQLSGDERARLISVEGRGALAGADLFTRAPLRIRFDQRTVETSLSAALGDGVVSAQWSERGRTLSGAARIEDAPLAPIAAIWGERAAGRIDGRINLANNGRGLSGAADITLMAARFVSRQRGTLDLHVVGDLASDRLTARIDAGASDGLLAHFAAEAPVVTSASPFRIALAPERRGRATWSVQGPAASLWAAARLPDQSLEGDLDGEGELQFGAGDLSGAGRIALSHGRFEDKLSGIVLTDLDMRLALDERGVSVENLSARGEHGGRLSATGGSANPAEGRIAVSVQGLRVASRPDARASASGELTLAWEGLHSSLSGALAIEQADLDIAASPNAGIATLEVVEINRPGDDDQAPPPPRRNGSTTLDVRITAPGRVFTRGRGVDAEWALDMRLGGTARRPLLFGEARAVRGTLALSGQPFEIENARIRFDGDPLDAQIDLSATRETADLSARVRLTGTARNPEIAFASDPPLPEDEILPQVLFGRSVADLSPFEAAQLAASLAALSGRASLDLVDAARAAAGLDRFNVRQDEGGGFLVAGGVYLTRDVYVELARTGLGQAQTRMEWTVRPRLVLVTSFSGGGDQRVSLRWRRESD